MCGIPSLINTRHVSKDEAAGNTKPNQAIETITTEQLIHSNQCMLHGNGRNRWFDKVCVCVFVCLCVCVYVCVCVCVEIYTIYVHLPPSAHIRASHTHT